MKRFDIINKLIEKRNYKTYLEIGTQFGECFAQIKIDYKECVDPEKNYSDLTHEMTSDEYFFQNTKTFDIIFVDGLHLEEQTTKDIENALKILNKNGVIVVHDCLPHCEEFTQVCWNGTVYKSIIELRYKNPNVNVHVVDTDCGCGIISKASKPQELYNAVPIETAKTYDYYAKHKVELMKTISVEQFLASLK